MRRNIGWTLIVLLERWSFSIWTKTTAARRTLRSQKTATSCCYLHRDRAAVFTWYLICLSQEGGAVARETSTLSDYQQHAATIVIRQKVTWSPLPPSTWEKGERRKGDGGRRRGKKVQNILDMDFIQADQTLQGLFYFLGSQYFQIKCIWRKRQERLVWRPGDLVQTGNVFLSPCSRDLLPFINCLNWAPNRTNLEQNDRRITFSTLKFDSLTCSHSPVNQTLNTSTLRFRLDWAPLCSDFPQSE